MNPQSTRSFRMTVARHRGFTLLHVLVAMPLIVVFMVFGTRLFLSNTKMLQQTADDRERLARTDMVLHRLRLDAWLSLQVTVDGRRLILEQPNDRVTWQIDEQGGLTRSVAGDTEHPLKIEGLDATTFGFTAGAVAIELGGERYLCPLGASPPVHPAPNRGDVP